MTLTRLSATTKPLLALSFVFATLFTTSTYAETNDMLMSKGMWKDPVTGLIWMRCSIGQTWTGKTCAGTASHFNWQGSQDAVAVMNRNGGFGGYTDWVVPDLEEFSSIVYCSNKNERGEHNSSTQVRTQKNSMQTVKYRACIGSYFKDSGLTHPTIEKQVFPNTPSRQYWSSSAHKHSDDHAWMIDFGYGLVKFQDRNFPQHVRAVRTAR